MMTETSPKPTKSAVLSLNNIEVVYDHVSLAIKGVSLEVPDGGMVALLGANGAGKSTSLKAISGLLVAERGEVRRGDIQFLDRNLRSLSPQRRVELGIAHVLEGRRVFEHLTPDENLIAASAIRSRHDMIRNKEKSLYLLSTPLRTPFQCRRLPVGRRAANVGNWKSSNDAAKAADAR